MNRLRIDACAVVAFLTTLGLAVESSTSQMGLRENDLFAPHRFAKVGPAIGSLAPELELTDLEGKKVSLKSYRGKVVVLVKGGYT